MSCGRPHDVPCTEVLDQLSHFIDSELDTATVEDIQRHLHECGPCLQQAEVERWLKARVAKCCAAEPVPEDVRSRVLQRFLVTRSEFTSVSRTDHMQVEVTYSETTVTTWSSDQSPPAGLTGPPDSGPGRR